MPRPRRAGRAGFGVEVAGVSFELAAKCAEGVGVGPRVCRDLRRACVSCFHSAKELPKVWAPWAEPRQRASRLLPHSRRCGGWPGRGAQRGRSPPLDLNRRFRVVDRRRDGGGEAQGRQSVTVADVLGPAAPLADVDRRAAASKSPIAFEQALAEAERGKREAQTAWRLNERVSYRVRSPDRLAQSNRAEGGRPDWRGKISN